MSYPYFKSFPSDWEVAMRKAGIPQHERADVYRLVFFAWSEGGINVSDEPRMRYLCAEMGVQWRRFSRSLEYYSALCQGGNLPVFLLKQFVETLPEVPANSRQIADKMQVNGSQNAGEIPPNSSQNTDKMQVNSSQNAAKIPPKTAKQGLSPLDSEPPHGNTHSHSHSHEPIPEERDSAGARGREEDAFSAFDPEPLAPPGTNPPERLPGELTPWEQSIAELCCEKSSHHAVKARVRAVAAELVGDGFGPQDVQDFRREKGAAGLNFLARDMRIWRQRRLSQEARNGASLTGTRPESAEERRHREFLEDIGALAPAIAVGDSGRDDPEIEMLATDGAGGAREYRALLGTGASGNP